MIADTSDPETAKALAQQIMAAGREKFEPIFESIYEENTVGAYLFEQSQRADAETKRVLLAIFDREIEQFVSWQTGLKSFLRLGTGLALSSVRPDPGPSDNYKRQMLMAYNLVSGITDFA